MPTEKRDRYLKRVRRRAARTSDRPKLGPSDRTAAIETAAVEKSKRLLELRSRYEPKIVELEEEWAEKRREVWADYEQRKALIRQATILGSKG